MTHNLLASKQASKQHYLYIDLLKSIAMLGVILVHFNGAYNCPVPIISKISAVGARCPQLFFIVSSFLTWKGLDKESVNWKKFFLSRFFRIAPLYYIALIVAVIIPKIKYVDMGSLLTHMVFINGLFPQWTNDIIGVEWYIADLALFYMLCPLIKAIVKDLNSCRFIFIISVILSGVVLVIFNAFGNGENSMYFETFCFIHQLPIILLGIMLYYVTKEKEDWKKVYISGAVIMLTIGAFLLLDLNKRFIRAVAK